MVARTMLAVLDNNFNVARTQAETFTGKKQWRLRWSKATKSFVVKKVYSQKDYSFRDDLMLATIERLESGKFC